MKTLSELERQSKLDAANRPKHVSPKLPDKFKHLEKYQYGELGVGMISSFNPNNTVEECNCPICNNKIISGRWDVVSKGFGKGRERLFICNNCELAYVSEIGEQKLKIYGNEKIKF